MYLHRAQQASGGDAPMRRIRPLSASPRARPDGNASGGRLWCPPVQLRPCSLSVCHTSRDPTFVSRVTNLKAIALQARPTAPAPFLSRRMPLTCAGLKCEMTLITGMDVTTHLPGVDPIPERRGSGAECHRRQMGSCFLYLARSSQATRLPPRNGEVL
jgi:hypothetical protein